MINSIWCSISMNLMVTGATSHCEMLTVKVNHLFSLHWIIIRTTNLVFLACHNLYLKKAIKLVTFTVLLQRENFNSIQFKPSHLPPNCWHHKVLLSFMFCPYLPFIHLDIKNHPRIPPNIGQAYGHNLELDNLKVDWYNILLFPAPFIFILKSSSTPLTP